MSDWAALRRQLEEVNKVRRAKGWEPIPDLFPQPPEDEPKVVPLHRPQKEGVANEATDE